MWADGAAFQVVFGCGQVCVWLCAVVCLLVVSCVKQLALLCLVVGLCPRVLQHDLAFIVNCV